jgi:CBS-domain-containing membrane protein
MKKNAVRTQRYVHFTRDVRRILFCAGGAASGLGLTLYLSDISTPFLLASIGGSTVFLFGLTRAAAAQPRALFGGHLGGHSSAFFAINCLGTYCVWVYVLAVVLTLAYMLITKTVHPPAGANPLIMVHSHAEVGCEFRIPTVTV